MTLKRFLSRMRSDASGNVLIIFGFAVIPMAFATAMGVDYAHAARLQTKMNSLADAAALAAVTQTMMSKDDATATDTARNMFNTQVALLNGVTYDPANLTIAITHPNGSGSRTAVVSYNALSINSFSGILGSPTIAIGGSSTSNNMVAPDIDFYLLLDTSPSMLLPATTAGLSSMQAAANGCSFACHQTNLTYNSSSNTELVCDSNKKNCKDYYTVAKLNNIILRTDLLHDAVENLTDQATSTSSQNGAKYRMGLFKFDKSYAQVWPQNPIGGYNVDSNLSNVKNHVTDAQVLTYCQNNYFTCGTNDNDTATNFTAAFTGMGLSLPLTPGNGTRVNGDTPQATLFLITDGMRDESSGGRKIGPLPTSLCTTIKSRGIRIAVLYTEYLPEAAVGQWSVDNVKTPYLSPTDKISPALQSCASPGLYYKVTTDSDISGALATLFQAAVATARLTK